MNTGRRSFIAGLMAATLAPRATWADAGSPAFLSAAKTTDGNYVLCGLGADLNLRFQLPLPTRGHAAAAHPTRAEAVAFARRPGTYAIVIDCVTGGITSQLTAPQGRHLYGHGTFSADGGLLFTTENDYDNGRGRIGVWDAHRAYTRIDEWDSGGIGPHDIKRLPGTNVMAVANGGIDTHPDTARTKLNIPSMRSNLSYVRDGILLDQMELGPDHQRNSIRHLAVRQDGLVAFGMQWQGDRAGIPLAGIHKMGTPSSLLQAEDSTWELMNGYVGSVAINSNGNSIAITSPRGGITLVIAPEGGELISYYEMDDVCGVTNFAQGFVASTGNGSFFKLTNQHHTLESSHRLNWDNHLILVAQLS